MSKKALLIVPLVVFLGIAGFLWQGLSLDPKILPAAMVGKEVPDFQLPTLLNNAQVVTSQILKGKVILLNVWASWCASCRAEHYVLMDIAHRYHMPIYGINYKDSAADARAWLKQAGNPYQQVMVDQKGELALNLGVYGTPETFVIDKTGTVRYRHVGPLSASDWEKELSPIIQRLQ